MHLLAWAPRCSCKKSTPHPRLPDSTVSTSTPSNSRYGHCIDGPCIDVKCAVDDTYKHTSPYFVLQAPHGGSLSSAHARRQGDRSASCGQRRITRPL